MKSITGTTLRRLAGIAAVGTVAFGLMVGTSGCGPEAASVSAPAPTNNAPPGGANVDDYARQMQQQQNRGGGTPGGGPPGPGGGGAPPGPGGR